MKWCGVILLLFVINVHCIAQVSVTIPWSSSLNITFGNGKFNPGPRLLKGYSDFTYTTQLCPSEGEYSVVNTEGCIRPIINDAGHVYFGVHPLDNDTGYMMLARYRASTTSKIIFRDTVKNLCSNNSYLFWAPMLNASNSTCFYPNLSMQVKTLNGQLIGNFQTGDIGGSTDNGRPYVGYKDPDGRATFPYFYGGTFKLPLTAQDVIVTILTNPTNTQNCSASLAIDNILLTPVGPDVTASIDGHSDSWLTSTCFNGGYPLSLSGNIGKGYHDFNTYDFISASFNNPAFQWQQSVDNGYTWTDLAGETSMHLSRAFTNPDTFFVRLRTSEAGNINNPNCSVVSNILQVNVDGEVKGFDITSNSPVCEDSDIVLNVSGGASYITTGPNNYYDNSPFPHVYHPQLVDSGWYKTQVITQGGCEVYDSTFVKVIGPQVFTSFFPDSVCYGQPVQLQASGAKTYVWTPSVYLNNANIANPIALPLTTTKYQLKGTDETGCSAFGSVTVNVKDSLLKAMFSSANIICPNDTARFTDSSIGAIKNWYWSFGNGETSNRQNPLPPHYSKTSELTYPVQLVVTDTSGCSDTSMKYIKTVVNCYIAVPSAFTPNHDGLNDYLFPLNAYKASGLIFTVYNRFGKAVFSTKDWTKKWDGTLNNMPQPAGTYIWVLIYTDENNNKISLKGTTVLIR